MPHIIPYLPSKNFENIGEAFVVVDPLFCPLFDLFSLISFEENLVWSGTIKTVPFDPETFDLVIPWGEFSSIGFRE